MHVDGVRVVCSHEGQQYVEAVPESEADIFSVYLVKQDQSMVAVADFYSMEGAKEFRDLIRAMFNGEINERKKNYVPSLRDGDGKRCR